MIFSLFIAKRYFFSKKKKHFINIISIISMVVVSIGTMSLIISLSVFNGLEGLFKNMYENFDPDLILTPVKGKSMVRNELLLEQLNRLDGVKGVSEVVADHVLLKFKGTQRVVKMKGVDTAFYQHSGLKEMIVAGNFPTSKDSIQHALIGIGIQYEMSINLNDDFNMLQVCYPKNIKPGVIQPTRMYNQLNINPGGVFAFEKYYDENLIFVPLINAKKLLNYTNKISALEIYLSKNANSELLKTKVENLSGSSYLVQMREELHGDIFKVLQIEKLFVFLVLITIVAVASINIFFSLTMLVIEKRKDISLLIAQGVTKKTVRNIFLIVGIMIGFVGTTSGLFLGLVLILIQKKYEIVGLGMETAIVNSYPVQIELMDIMLSFISIYLITFLASILPARNAYKFYSVQYLQ